MASRRSAPNFSQSQYFQLDYGERTRMNEFERFQMVSTIGNVNNSAILPSSQGYQETNFRTARPRGKLSKSSCNLPSYASRIKEPYYSESHIVSSSNSSSYVNYPMAGGNLSNIRENQFGYIGNSCSNLPLGIPNANEYMHRHHHGIYNNYPDFNQRLSLQESNAFYESSQWPGIWSSSNSLNFASLTKPWPQNNYLNMEPRSNQLDAYYNNAVSISRCALVLRK